MITDEREIAVALAPRDLIQRDLKQIAQPVDGQKLVADALDDPPDGLPVDPDQPAGCGSVGLGHQPRHEVFEVAGEASAVTGERHALDQRPVLGAAQPPEPGMDLQSPDPQVQVAPDGVVVLGVLARHRLKRALRADKLLALQGDRDHHPIATEGDLSDPHPGQAQQTRECSGDAHRRRPPVRRTQTTREPTGPSPCASPKASVLASSHPARVSPASMPASDPLAQPPRSATSTGTTAPALASDLQNRSRQYKAPAHAKLNRSPESPTIIHGAPDLRRALGGTAAGVTKKWRCDPSATQRLTERSRAR